MSSRPHLAWRGSAAPTARRGGAAPAAAVRRRASSPAPLRAAQGSAGRDGEASKQQPWQPQPTRVRVPHDGHIRVSRLAFWEMLQGELRRDGDGDDDGDDLRAAASLLAALESVYG
jgi:hypothetical protein